MSSRRTTYPHTSMNSVLNHTDLSRSIEMYSMHEALARDRMREAQRRSQQSGLARELAAQRRWHWVSRYARAAEKRHARKVDWALAR